MPSAVLPQPKPKRGRPRKLDAKKVLALADKGLSPGDIAKHQGVERTTVWRFLQQAGRQTDEIKAYKTDRADTLTVVHAEATELQLLAIRAAKEKLSDGECAAALTPQAIKTLGDLGTYAGGVAYDKERIERGPSAMPLSIPTALQQAFTIALTVNVGGQLRNGEPVNIDVSPTTGSGSPLIEKVITEGDTSNAALDAEIVK